VSGCGNPRLQRPGSASQGENRLAALRLPRVEQTSLGGVRPALAARSRDNAALGQGAGTRGEVRIPADTGSGIRRRDAVGDRSLSAGRGPAWAQATAGTPGVHHVGAHGDLCVRLPDDYLQAVSCHSLRTARRPGARTQRRGASLSKLAGRQATPDASHGRTLAPPLARR
jgi:hypothetical protein